MAITYHAGRRIQGVASTVTNSTTGGAFVDVVFDASTEIGSLTYSGNTITRSVDSYSRSAINANFQFNNTGTQQLELVAQKTGTSAWFHFGLASAKCVDVGATGNASSQFEYAIRSADDGRTWIRQSSGAWTQVSDTADNSTYKIVNNRTTVTYYANGSSIGTTTHATPNAKYYPMIIVAQTGVDGSYALDYSGDIITTTPATWNWSNSSQNGATHGYCQNGSSSNIIDRFAFSTDADAVSVGTCVTNTYERGASSDITGGYSYVFSGNSSNAIERHQNATSSNGSTVGTITQTVRLPSSSESSTHGYRAGGWS